MALCGLQSKQGSSCLVRHIADAQRALHTLYMDSLIFVACETRGLSDVISSHGVITCRTREWNIS